MPLCDYVLFRPGDVFFSVTDIHDDRISRLIRNMQPSTTDFAEMLRMVEQYKDHFGRPRFASLCTMHPSFLGLDSTDNPDPVSTGFFSMMFVIIFYFFDVHLGMLAHSHFFACRIGEAKNPGPGSKQLRLAITNPTALNKKVSRLLQLKADILTASETSATSIIQKRNHQRLQPEWVPIFLVTSCGPKKTYS